LIGSGFGGSGVLAASLLALVAVVSASGQGVRDHTRPTPQRSTAVSESQAGELTLTVTEAAVRPIQVWVRTAGRMSASGATIEGSLPLGQAALVRVGQRVRAFPPESRSRMSQARVSRVVTDATRARITATLTGPGLAGGERYILEIVTERGESLSVPNEAIIETGGARVVYVEQARGRYAPRQIQTGVQGELFTEVVSGLKAGEKVVTIGSFFIDAEHKLKGS
jgi:hypothetical protein